MRAFSEVSENKKSEASLHSFCCGEKGIRTPGTRKSTTVFETAPFDHSGISPCVAEKEGFEPPEPSRVQRFSRPPHSTTLPFLRAVQKYYKLNSRQSYFPYFLITHNTIIINILNKNFALRQIYKAPICEQKSSFCNRFFRKIETEILSFDNNAIYLRRLCQQAATYWNHRQ